MRRPSADAPAYALFLLLACILLWPVVLRGEALLPLQYIALFFPWQETAGRTLTHPPAWNALLADSILQYLPWRQFARETLHSGFLPLWNPHQFCGTPFLANYQSALFYPPNLLFWVLPAVHAFGASAILHLFLAGAFVFLYLRGRGVDRGAALLGGITFELSGFLLSWLELPTAVNVAVWLPLALHLYERSRREPGPLRGIPTTFPLAMILLAGHPQFAFYALLAFAAYALAHIPEGSEARGRAVGLLACAGVPAALAGMLASAQVLPMLELSRLSHRGGGPLFSLDPAGYQQALPLWASVVLALPDFFGNPMRGDFWGPVNRAEFVGYAGVLPLLLSAAALLAMLLPSSQGPWRAALPGGAGRRVAFFALLAMVAVAASFRNPVGEALYRVVPGLGRFGSPGRMLYLSTLAVSLIAGFGLHALARRADRSRLIGLAAALAATGGVALWVAAGAGSSAMGAGDPVAVLAATASGMGRFLGLLLLSAGVLAAGARLSPRAMVPLATLVLAADLLAAGWGQNPTAPPSLAYPDDPVLAELQRDPDSRFVAVTPRWSLQGYPIALLPPNSATACGLADVNGYDSLYGMGYKTYLNRLAGRETSPAANGNMVLFVPQRGEDLRRLACRTLVSLDPVEDPALELVSEGTVRVYRLRGECPRAFVSNGAEGPPLPGAEASLTSAGPTRVSVQASAPREGRLILLDSYFPGWRATVDGKAAPIEQVRDVFRAIRVAAGSHRVEFRYRPASFGVGLFLSLMGLALGVGAGVARCIHKKAALPASGQRRDEEL